MNFLSFIMFKFYNVKNIIRIGTCGAYSPKLNLLDTILVDNSYTIGNFAKALNNDDCHLVHSSDKINNKIQEVGISLGYNFKKIEPNNSQETLDNNNNNNSIYLVILKTLQLLETIIQSILVIPYVVKFLIIMQMIFKSL